MTDSLTITTHPKYNALYLSMKPREVRRLENFNGERYLTAKRSQGCLKIVTEKLDPRRRGTLTRTMENFGTESAPVLADVSVHFTAPHGDLVVYIDKAKYNEDILRAIFITGPNKIQTKLYNTFEQMRKDKFFQEFIKKITSLKPRI